MTDAERPAPGTGGQPTLPVDLTKQPQRPAGLDGFTVDLRKPGAPAAAAPPQPPSPPLNLTKPVAAPRPSPAPPAWQPAAPTAARSAGRSTPAIAAIAVLAILLTAVAAYLLTRPDSVPGTGTAGSNSHGNNTPSAITPCATAPNASVQSMAMTSSGLSLTVDLASACGGGDVLTDPQLQLTVTDGSRDIAAAVFDTSADPVVITPGDTVTRTFVFPPGAYWQTPETVDAQGSALQALTRRTGTAGRSAVTIDDGSSTLTATGAAAPALGNTDSAALDGLRSLAAADQPVIASTLANRWVPQISSKQPGLVAEGLTWTAPDILREHLDLRQRYPDVRLVWSGDWRTFNSPDWWVTIVGIPSSGSSTALSWCATNGFDADHCYAKIVSATMGREGTTVLRK